MHQETWNSTAQLSKSSFEIENSLSEEIAKTREGVMSIDECEIALKTMENNSWHRWVNA